jgi:hypothetical protein
LLIATLVSCGDTPAEPEKAVDTAFKGALPDTFEEALKKALREIGR